jgi:hypothetical protein
MVNCKNCGCSVFGRPLFCRHCGYPMAVARWVPWPRQWRPASPLKFWNAVMVSSLVLVAVAAVGIAFHVHLGLSSLYCGYLFVLSLPVFFWADLGSQKCLRG